jgi:hypothetical protein
MLTGMHHHLRSEHTLPIYPTEVLLASLPSSRAAPALLQ